MLAIMIAPTVGIDPFTFNFIAPLLAIIYPSILLLVGGGVSLFLITYVVPRFAEVYQGAGRNLPWMSQMMLGWGQFAGAHSFGLGLTIAGTLAAAFFGIRHLLRSGGIARLLARVPAIGERVRNISSRIRSG